MNKITQSVVDTLTVDGIFNFEGLKEVIAELSAVRKEKKEEAHKVELANRAANREALAEKGKIWFDALEEGAPVSYTMSDGTIVTGVKGAVKNGAKTAHVVLAEIPEGSKTKDRYPKYNQLNID